MQILQQPKIAKTRQKLNNAMASRKSRRERQVLIKDHLFVAKISKSLQQGDKSRSHGCKDLKIWPQVWHDKISHVFLWSDPVILFTSLYDHKI